MARSFYCRSMSDNTLRGLAGPACENRVNVTPRVEQTFELLLEGGSEKEMARQLGISRHTLHLYVKLLYRHFDVSSRAELMALALKAILKSSTRGNLFSQMNAAQTSLPRERDGEMLSHRSVA